MKKAEKKLLQIKWKKSKAELQKDIDFGVCMCGGLFIRTLAKTHEKKGWKISAAVDAELTARYGEGRFDATLDLDAKKILLKKDQLNQWINKGYRDGTKFEDVNYIEPITEEMKALWDLQEQLEEKKRNK
jgi:hypothetical protein